ncbi:MAG: recombination mediator RecR [Culturomica sp.]|jgi:recombination protein RecR|nr:recombination mediator RecR [Culturomica sp.]
MQSLSSKLLDRAVEQFALLPGIGRKTALRFALFLLKRKPEEVEAFVRSIEALKTDIRTCRQCNNISDNDLCEICADPKRDGSVICVVENIRDILSIEATSQYRGLYHVLGGIISPMEGTGPADLHIASLLSRLEHPGISEVLFALSATIEGETTAYYIYKKIPNRENLIISTLAKGISVGNDLEYTDQLTLGKSILNRVHFTGK